ncbi:hypothetical protein HDF11_001867 [Tunturiibacter psychrotolerans]
MTESLEHTDGGLRGALGLEILCQDGDVIVETLEVLS